MAVKKFPGVFDKETSDRYIDLNERYLYQYQIIMKYLQKSVTGWNAGKFFDRNDIRHLIVYAITEFTDLVIEDLNHAWCKVNVDCVCDKSFEKFSHGYKGLDVVGIDTLLKKYQSGEADKILICSIFHENEVYQELMNLGISQKDLISVIDVIFDDSEDITN